MIEGLGDSDRAYNDRNAGEKDKTKKCSTSFRTKNTSFNKNHADDLGALRLKWLKNRFKKYLKNGFVLLT